MTRLATLVCFFLLCGSNLPAQTPSASGKFAIIKGPQERFAAGRKWAVLVGISKYLDSGISDLQYCVKDARLMERTLVERCSYESKRVLVIADDQNEEHLKPLRFNLDQKIRHWLMQAKPGDTVMVFFSGHGFLDEQGQGFLAAKDTRHENLGLTALRTDALRDMLRQCDASQKLLILDCCHSGGAKGVDNGASGEELGAAFLNAEGLITLASCRKKQQSVEWDEKGYGLFTYFLALGLWRGTADFDHNGIVDSDELYRFVSDTVPLTAQRELNSMQTPVRLISEDVVGVFGLARVTGSKPVRVNAHGRPIYRYPEPEAARPSAHEGLFKLAESEYLVGNYDLAIRHYTTIVMDQQASQHDRTKALIARSKTLIARRKNGDVQIALSDRKAAGERGIRVTVASGFAHIWREVTKDRKRGKDFVATATSGDIVLLSEYQRDWFRIDSVGDDASLAGWIRRSDLVRAYDGALISLREFELEGQNRKFQEEVRSKHAERMRLENQSTPNKQRHKPEAWPERSPPNGVLPAWQDNAIDRTSPRSASPKSDFPSRDPFFFVP